MKITKHLINILCLSFLIYAPFSNAEFSPQPTSGKSMSCYSWLGTYTCGNIVGTSFTPSGSLGSCSSGGVTHRFHHGSGQYTYSYEGKACAQSCPANSVSSTPNQTKDGSSCSCKAGYVEETVNGVTSCQLAPCQAGYQRVPPSTTCTPIPPPSCEAPYVYDPATNSCQLTACPVGFERVPPSTSCTPIKCEPPSVMGENGVCVIPPCPIGFERINGVCTRSCENLGGEPTESSMCNYWHKYIDQCRYDAKEIEVKCTNQALHNPNGGLTDIPLCKRYGKFYEGVIDKTPWSARPVFGCSKTPPDTVTTITLAS